MCRSSRLNDATPPPVRKSGTAATEMKMGSMAIELSAE
jgi:hypothetical protein